jgi:hypothetical protein
MDLEASRFSEYIILLYHEKGSARALERVERKMCWDLQSLGLGHSFAIWSVASQLRQPVGPLSGQLFMTLNMCPNSSSRIVTHSLAKWPTFEHLLHSTPSAERGSGHSREEWPLA